MTYFIDLRADSAGGNPVSTVDDIVVRTDAQPHPNPGAPLGPELIQAIQGRDLLLGTHGFNVNRNSGISNLGHWNEWLRLGGNGVFVAVLWPGDSRWLPVVDYVIEGDEAIRSGKLLAQYVGGAFAGAATLSFASHSLGARTMLETIRRLPDSFNSKLKSFTIMAGAIDDTCLNDEYADAAARLKAIFVLASHCDEVLKLAFPVGNPIAGIVTRGDPYWHGALGRFGPNPPGTPSNVRATPILPDSWNFGHHSYINCDPGAAGQSAGFYPPALIVSGEGAPVPSTVPPSSAVNWQPAWAAGFVSTCYSS